MVDDVNENLYAEIEDNDEDQVLLHICKRKFIYRFLCYTIKSVLSSTQISRTLEQPATTKNKSMYI